MGWWWLNCNSSVHTELPKNSFLQAEWVEAEHLSKANACHVVFDDLILRHGK